MSTGYNIKFPREYMVENERPVTGEVKTRWVTIGRATAIKDGVIICRIDSVPLNWDGVFHLFPRDTPRDWHDGPTPPYDETVKKT